MKVINRFALFCNLILLSVLYSCKCDCTCEKKVGCKILTVKLKSNGNIIQTKTICTENNILAMDFQDSVTVYTNHYQSDSTTVVTKDSIFKDDVVKKLSCSQADPYTSKGYYCGCAK